MTPVKISPIFFLFPLLCLAACTKPPPAQSEFVLGTICTVNLYGEGTQKRYGEIFSRIRAVDREMSVNQDSDVIRINQSAGTGQAVKVPQNVIDVLEQACYYADLSGGAFDPTVGPLVKLWGIGTETPRIPDESEIAAALKLIDWRDLVIDKDAGTAWLRRPGQALDLGAIAKGYAADQAAAVVRAAGIRGALIDLGGNIYVTGSRGDADFKRGIGFFKNTGRRKASDSENDRPWRVGVQDPLQGRGAYIGILQIRNKSVVTSGIYERYFESGGKRYHHILSTSDGCPVENGLLSVTIIAESSTTADGLSTSVFALGYEKGRALIDSLKNVEAIFIFEDRSVQITNGLRDIFTLTSNEYSLYPR
ncbi:MAG: FAD:protein FMN transferase [Treponema sp.]|nr:FAD:protein FMN transferase [Treponema sp.]